MKHCNGNLICAVAITTAGPTPGYNELLEIAIIPLDDDLKQLRAIPFNVIMRLDYPERLDRDWVRKTGYIESLEKIGVEKIEAMEMLEAWKSRLGLKFQKFSGEEKKLMPIVYRAGDVIPHLRAWLGDDYDAIFHEQVRDLHPISLYANDRAAFEGKLDMPFPKHNFTYVANKFQIKDFEYNRYPLTRAKMIADLYRAFCFQRYII